MHNSIEKQYYFPRFTVGVVNFAQEFVGSALRSVAESVTCATRHYYPGTPVDFLKTIGSSDHEEMMIISGHGARKGMCFCESYSKPDIDDSMLLPGGYMPASVIKEHLRIQNSIVYGAFCHSGTDEMIDAYARNGNLYIGKREPLNSHTAFMPVFLSKFLFGIIMQEQTPEESFMEARAIGREADRDELVLCRDRKILVGG